MQVRGHTDWVSSAAFSPDGQLLVTASQDGSARVWETATGASIADLLGHTDSVVRARFSPDGAGLDDETKLAFTIGGGLRIPINDRFGVRLDLRAFGTVLDSDSDIFCVSSGGATCRIQVKSDFFLQYSANLGVTIGF